MHEKAIERTHSRKPGAYPSLCVSGLAWKPKGLSFLQAFLSSARRIRATPDIFTQVLPVALHPTKIRLLPFRFRIFAGELIFLVNRPATSSKVAGGRHIGGTELTRLI